MFAKYNQKCEKCCRIISKGHNLLNKYVYTIYEWKEKRMKSLKILSLFSTHTSKPCAISRSQRSGQAVYISKSQERPNFLPICKLNIYLAIPPGLNI